MQNEQKKKVSHISHLDEFRVFFLLHFSTMEGKKRRTIMTERNSVLLWICEMGQTQSVKKSRGINLPWLILRVRNVQLFFYTSRCTRWWGRNYATHRITKFYLIKSTHLGDNEIIFVSFWTFSVTICWTVVDLISSFDGIIINSTSADGDILVIFSFFHFDCFTILSIW